MSSATNSEKCPLPVGDRVAILVIPSSSGRECGRLIWRRGHLGWGALVSPQEIQSREAIGESGDIVKDTSL